MYRRKYRIRDLYDVADVFNMIIAKSAKDNKDLRHDIGGICLGVLLCVFGLSCWTLNNMITQKELKDEIDKLKKLAVEHEERIQDLELDTMEKQEPKE